MTTLAVQHRVQDFDAWKVGFAEHSTVRKQHGCTGDTVLRLAEDPNNVLILMQWPTMEHAHAFLDDPSLPEAMQRAGVLGAPRIELYEEASS